MLETPYLLFTKKRLIQWGYWYNQTITMGLGYSSKSLIAEMEENGVIIPSTLKLLAPNNAEAEEVNQLIEQMAENPDESNHEWAKVICIHYTVQEKNVQLKIQRSGLSKKMYYRHLQDAEYWLSRQLGIN